MSAGTDQRIVASLAMIAGVGSTTLSILEKMDIGQQTQIALSESILSTLKKNGGNRGGGGGVLSKLASMKNGMKDIGISSLKDMKEAVEILPKLAIAMFKFNVLAGSKVKRNVISFITKFREAIQGDTSKADFKSFGEGFGLVANSLKKMAFSMRIFTKVATAKSQKVTLDFIGSLVDTLGNIDAKKVKEGTSALGKISKSLAILSLTLLASSLVMAIAAPIAAVVLVPVVAGLAFLFDMLGKASEPIDKGAASLARMSISVAMFGLSMWAVSAMGGVDFKSITEIVGAMAIMGLAFWAIGKYAAVSVEGALAITLMSASIALLAAGLYIFKETDFGLKDAGILAVTLTGISLIMAVAGLESIFIVAGAIAIGVAGLALIVLGIGLATYRAMNFSKTDADGLKFVIGGIAEGFSAMGFGGGVAMLLGSAALTMASLSLISLSLGLGAYRLLNFKQADVVGLKSIIGGMAEGFSAMGIGGGVAMLLGSAALTAASLSLLALSAGLWAYRALEFKPKDVETLKGVIVGMSDAFKSMGVTGAIALTGGGAALIAASLGLVAISGALWLINKIDFATLAKTKDNIASVISVISAAFGAVGKDEDSGMFTTGTVGRGVNAVKGMGTVLVDIARGVQAFANFTFKDSKGDTVTLDDKKLEQVKTNIVSMVNALAGVFATIGQGTKGTFGKLVDMAVGGDTERGIKAVQGMGLEIGGIATAVAAFAASKFDPAMATSIGKGISGMIGELMKIEVDTKKHEALNSMGRFLTKLSTLQKPLEGVSNSIKTIVVSMERLYASISKVSEKSMYNAATVLQSIAALSTANGVALSTNVDFTKKVVDYSIEKGKNGGALPAVLNPLANVDPAPASRPTPAGEKSTNISATAAPVNYVSAPDASSAALHDIAKAIELMTKEITMVKTLLQGTLKVRNADGMGMERRT